MADKVCKGCGGVMEVDGIEPFTVCECSDCGTEIVIPLDLDYLSLEKPLGKSGFFEIYEGFDGADNMNSVIYLLATDIENYADALKAAKDEALALSTLKHNNICPMINFGEVEGRFFAAEPKMDGYPMASYAPDSQGLLDVDSVVDVLQAAALGLATAHHKEFVHHNICDKTIHIDARGNVRVKNFFISRFTYMVEQRLVQDDDVPAGDDPEQTQISREKQGIPVSSVSPYFISPEKAESGVEDKRGDIFSFGVLFYFMITGNYPFAGSSEIETVYSRIKKKKSAEEEIFSTQDSRVATPDTVEYIPPQHPHEIRPEIPEKISAMIMDTLSYLPVYRPKFSEVLNTINLYKAKQYQEKTVSSAQKQMVETKTRAIPMMKNLYDAKIGGDGEEVEGDKKKKKRLFFK